MTKEEIEQATRLCAEAPTKIAAYYNKQLSQELIVRRSDLLALSEDVSSMRALLHKALAEIERRDDVLSRLNKHIVWLRGRIDESMGLTDDALNLAQILIEERNVARAQLAEAKAGNSL